MREKESLSTSIDKMLEDSIKQKIESVGEPTYKVKNPLYHEDEEEVYTHFIDITYLSSNIREPKEWELAEKKYFDTANNKIYLKYRNVTEVIGTEELYLKVGNYDVGKYYTFDISRVKDLVTENAEKHGADGIENAFDFLEGYIELMDYKESVTPLLRIVPNKYDPTIYNVEVMLFNEGGIISSLEIMIYLNLLKKFEEENLGELTKEYLTEEILRAYRTREMGMSHRRYQYLNIHIGKTIGDYEVLDELLLEEVSTPNLQRSYKPNVHNIFFYDEDGVYLYQQGEYILIPKEEEVHTIDRHMYFEVFLDNLSKQIAKKEGKLREGKPEGYVKEVQRIGISWTDNQVQLRYIMNDDTVLLKWTGLLPFEEMDNLLDSLPTYVRKALEKVEIEG